MALKPRGISILDIPSTFPLFLPNSAGSYESISKLTIQAVNDIVPCLLDLSVELDLDDIPIVDTHSICHTKEHKEKSKILQNLLDHYGSDKGSYHLYHYLYAYILNDQHNVDSILEVGLGTNNTDIVSNMGAGGIPGASLRGFRDFLPNANIYGADIDSRVLFDDDRIQSFHVDQTSRSSLAELATKLPSQLDLGSLWATGA